MGSVLSSPLSYWRSETNLSGSSDSTSDNKDQQQSPPPDQGHSSKQSNYGLSNDENGQNGDTEDDDKTDERDEDEEQNSALVESTEDIIAVNCEEQEPASSATHNEFDQVQPENSNNALGEETDTAAFENGSTNGNLTPVIMLNDISISQQHQQQFDDNYPADFEAAKAAYAARHNLGKQLINTHLRQNHLTVESRKRDHSEESDRSTPIYQHNYLKSNDLPLTSRSKRQKSSETDSVSSSRSDRASVEIEQVTPKPAKTRKRRGKASKKYVS